MFFVVSLLLYESWQDQATINTNSPFIGVTQRKQFQSSDKDF